MNSFAIVLNIRSVEIQIAVYFQSLDLDVFQHSNAKSFI